MECGPKSIPYTTWETRVCIKHTMKSVIESFNCSWVSTLSTILFVGLRCELSFEECLFRNCETQRSPSGSAFSTDCKMISYAAIILLPFPHFPLIFQASQMAPCPSLIPLPLSNTHWHALTPCHNPPCESPVSLPLATPNPYRPSLYYRMTLTPKRYTTC